MFVENKTALLAATLANELQVWRLMCMSAPPFPRSFPPGFPLSPNVVILSDGAEKSKFGAVIPAGRSYVELQVSCADDEGNPFRVPTAVYRWRH